MQAGYPPTHELGGSLCVSFSEKAAVSTTWSHRHGESTKALQWQLQLGKVNHNALCHGHEGASYALYGYPQS